MVAYAIPLVVATAWHVMSDVHQSDPCFKQRVRKMQAPSDKSVYRCMLTCLGRLECVALTFSTALGTAAAVLLGVASPSMDERCPCCTDRAPVCLCT